MKWRLFSSKKKPGNEDGSANRSSVESISSQPKKVLTPLQRTLQGLQVLWANYVQTSGELERQDILRETIAVYSSLDEPVTGDEDLINAHEVLRGDMTFIGEVARMFCHEVSLVVKSGSETGRIPSRAQFMSRTAVADSGISIIECLDVIHKTAISEQVASTLSNTGTTTFIVKFVLEAMVIPRYSSGNLEQSDPEMKCLTMLRRLLPFQCVIRELLQVDGMSKMFEGLVMEVPPANRLIRDKLLECVSTVVYDQRLGLEGMERLRESESVQNVVMTLGTGVADEFSSGSIVNTFLMVGEMLKQCSGTSCQIPQDFKAIEGYQILESVVVWLAEIQEYEAGSKLLEMVHSLVFVSKSSKASSRIGMFVSDLAVGGMKRGSKAANTDALRVLVNVFVTSQHEETRRSALHWVFETFAANTSNYDALRDCGAGTVILSVFPTVSSELRHEIINLLSFLVTVAGTTPEEELHVIGRLLTDPRSDLDCIEQLTEFCMKATNFDKSMSGILSSAGVVSCAIQRLRTIVSGGRPLTRLSVSNRGSPEEKRVEESAIVGTQEEAMIVSLVKMLGVVVEGDPSVAVTIREEGLSPILHLMVNASARKGALTLLNRITSLSPHLLDTDVGVLVQLLARHADKCGLWDLKKDLCNSLQWLCIKEQKGRDAFHRHNGQATILALLNGAKGVLDVAKGNDLEDFANFFRCAMRLLAASGLMVKESLSSLTVSPASKTLLHNIFKPEILAESVIAMGAAHSPLASFLIVELLECSLGSCRKSMLLPPDQSKHDAELPTYFVSLEFAMSISVSKVELPPSLPLEYPSFALAVIRISDAMPEFIAFEALTLVGAIASALPCNSNRLCRSGMAQIALDILFGKRHGTVNSSIGNSEEEKISSKGSRQISRVGDACLGLISCATLNCLASSEVACLLASTQHPVIGGRISQLIANCASSMCESCILLMPPLPDPALSCRCDLDDLSARAPGHLTIQFTDESISWPPSGGFSVCLWVCVDNATDLGGVILLELYSKSSQLMRLIIEDGNIRMESMGKDTISFNAVHIEQNQWHHIAITHRHHRLQTSECRLYLDGAVCQTIPISYGMGIRGSHQLTSALFGSAGSVCGATWRLGSTVVAAEAVDSLKIASIFREGPNITCLPFGEKPSRLSAEAELSAFVSKTEPMQRVLDLPESQAKVSQDKVIFSLCPAMIGAQLKRKDQPDQLQMRSILRRSRGEQGEIGSFSDGVSPNDGFEELAIFESNLVPSLTGLSDAGVAIIAGNAAPVISKPIGDALLSCGSVVALLHTVWKSNSHTDLSNSLSALCSVIKSHAVMAHEFEGLQGHDVLSAMLSLKYDLVDESSVASILKFVGWEPTMTNLSIVRSVSCCASLVLTPRVWSAAPDILLLPMFQMLVDFLAGNVYHEWNARRLLDARAVQLLCLMLADMTLPDKVVPITIRFLENLLLECVRNASLSSSHATHAISELAKFMYCLLNETEELPILKSRSRTQLLHSLLDMLIFVMKHSPENCPASGLFESAFNTQWATAFFACGNAGTASRAVSLICLVYSLKGSSAKHWASGGGWSLCKEMLPRISDIAGVFVSLVTMAIGCRIGQRYDLIEQAIVGGKLDDDVFLSMLQDTAIVCPEALVQVLHLLRHNMSREASGQGTSVTDLSHVDPDDDATRTAPVELSCTVVRLLAELYDKCPRVHKAMQDMHFLRSLVTTLFIRIPGSRDMVTLLGNAVESGSQGSNLGSRISFSLAKPNQGSDSPAPEAGLTDDEAGNEEDEIEGATDSDEELEYDDDQQEISTPQKTLPKITSAIAYVLQEFLRRVMEDMIVNKSSSSTILQSLLESIPMRTPEREAVQFGGSMLTAVTKHLYISLPHDQDSMSWDHLKSQSSFVDMAAGAMVSGVCYGAFDTMLEMSSMLLDKMPADRSQEEMADAIKVNRMLKSSLLRSIACILMAENSDPHLVSVAIRHLDERCAALIEGTTPSSITLSYIAACVPKLWETVTKSEENSASAAMNVLKTIAELRYALLSSMTTFTNDSGKPESLMDDGFGDIILNDGFEKFQQWASRNRQYTEAVLKSGCGKYTKAVLVKERKARAAMIKKIKIGRATRDKKLFTVEQEAQSKMEQLLANAATQTPAMLKAYQIELARRSQNRDSNLRAAVDDWFHKHRELDAIFGSSSPEFMRQNSMVEYTSKSKHSINPVWSSAKIDLPVEARTLSHIEGPDRVRLRLDPDHDFLQTFYAGDMKLPPVDATILASRRQLYLSERSKEIVLNLVDQATGSDAEAMSLETISSLISQFDEDMDEEKQSTNKIHPRWLPKKSMQAEAVKADASSLNLADPIPLQRAKRKGMGQQVAAIQSAAKAAVTAAVSTIGAGVGTLGGTAAAFVGVSSPDKDAHSPSPSPQTAADLSEESLVLCNERLSWISEMGDEALHAFNCFRLQGSERMQGILIVCRMSLLLLEGIYATPEGELEVVREELSEWARRRSSSINEAPDLSISHTTNPLLQIMNGECVSEHVESVKVIAIDCEKIAEIHKRNCLLRPVGVELLIDGGEGFLLSFNKSERDEAYGQISELSQRVQDKTDKATPAQTSQEPVDQEASSLKGSIRALQRKWLRGELTNFAYLIALNLAAGRTTNDYTQYPVFPWILQNFTSSILDLQDESAFRDLSKPMGAIGASRAEEFQRRFDTWPDPSTPKFHYGTHYSSAAGVMYYLLRMQPYTRHHLLLQNGHFDHADRLFFSLDDAWNSSSQKSLSDVKELTPEFFSLPDFLTNSSGFGMGFRQSGEPVGDVVLPPWCHDDALEFVRMHRQALESPIVSKNLHKWIDLIFGYQQTGPEAEAAMNVFSHLTYEGSVDVDSIEDPMMRRSILAQILNFGQTPKKLFDKPHPVRSCEASPAAFPSSQTVARSPAVLNPIAQKSIDGRVVDGRLIGGKLYAVSDRRVMVGPRFVKYMSFRRPDGCLRLHTFITTPRHPTAHKLVAAFEQMHPNPISALGVSDDGITICTGAEDGGSCIWEMVKQGHSRKMTLRARMIGHFNAITVCKVSRSHGVVATGSKDKSISVWNLQNGMRLWSASGLSSEIVGISIGSHMGWLYVATKNTLYIFSLNGQALAEAEVRAEISSLCASPMPEWSDFNVFSTGHSNGKICFWNVVPGHAEVEDEECMLESQQPGRYKVSLKALKQHGEGVAVTAFGFSSDHMRCWSGGIDGSLLLWQFAESGDTGHWVDDSRATQCGLCGVKFTVIDRRHHCRKCGNIVCGRCSSGRRAIPQLSFFTPVRVCDVCKRDLDG